MLFEIWMSWGLLEFFINSSREADDLFSMVSLVVREIMNQNVVYGKECVNCVKVRYCYCVIKYKWVKEDNYVSLSIYDNSGNEEFSLVRSWVEGSREAKDYTEDIFNSWNYPKL